MAENTQVVAKPEMNTKLSYYTNQYTGLMERDFTEHGLQLDDYSKQCVMASMSCNKLDIKQKSLKAKEFNEAVEESQIIVMEMASKIYQLAGDFVKNVHDNNEFTSY